MRKQNPNRAADSTVVSPLLPVTMDFVPMGVTTQILSMLPARSVLQCRSVCKAWRNLIDEPGFAALHLDREIGFESHAGNRKQTRFFLRPVNANDVAIYLVEQEQDSHVFKCTQMPLSFPKTTSPVNLLPLTATNGLFCIIDVDRHTFLLCNLFTGQCLSLPQLQSHSLEKGYTTRGFGYDITNRVFKAVQMFVPHNISSPTETEAHVYTILGSDSSWKKLDNASSIKCRGSAVVVNAHLHWLSDINSLILSFDLSSEKFGFIPLPQLGSSLHTPSSIENFDGCLSILVDTVDADGNHFELWVMKDYGVTESWTKIVVSLKRAFLSGITPISFWKEGEILLAYGVRTLVSYNVESGTYTTLDVIGLPHCYYFSVFPYCGNLLSLQPAS